MRDAAPVFRVVLTGGPCGGKSSGMEIIARRLAEFGFDVYRVPEAATLVLSGGVQIRGMAAYQLTAFQSHLLRIIRTLEDSFYAMAKTTGRPSVLLCDRGCMDGAAYVSREVWAEILRENDWTAEQVCNSRYDAVIHLMTAAEGAESFYTIANNAVRSETPQRARELDLRVRDAWSAHPYFRIIDNSTDFAGKIDRAISEVASILGIPTNKNQTED